MKHFCSVILLAGVLLVPLLGCKNKQQQAQQALEVQHIEVNVDDFLRTAKTGDVNNLRLLLQAGIDIDAADTDGNTALHAAAMAGQVETVEFLLANNANLNQVNERGETPLMVAVAANEVPMVKKLLAEHADETTQDRAGQTALYMALAQKQKEIWPLLLHEGPALNLATKEGKTPLSIAPDLAVAKELLKAGAKPGKSDMIQGQPLLVWAVAKKDLALAKQLLAAGVDVDTFVRTPASNSFVAVVGDSTLEYYLKRDDGVTSLMIAAGQGNIEMVRLLLANGAKRYRETKKSGSAAIAIASTNHRTKVIQILLGRSPAPEDQIYKIEINLSRQQLVVFRGGNVWLRSPVSTGAQGFSTPTGEFVVTNKYRDWVSTLYKDASMPFFMRLNCSAVGMHAGLLPGYPASHGCIRLPYENAQKIFQQVDVGTIVRIID